MRTLILSDLHLGTPASKAHAMLEDIEVLARQFDRVILNGDTLDRYELSGCTPIAEGLIRDARSACTSRSGPPEFLTGNHDPAISDQHWVYLEDSQTLVFHGDCVADCTHPSKPDEQCLARRLAAAWQEMGGRPARFQDLAGVYRRVQGEHLRENPRHKERCGKLRYLLRVFYPPQKPLHVLMYWHRAPRRAAELGATFDRPVRHVVIGHTHRAGTWRRGKVQVYNTGSFMPVSTPYAIVEEGHEIHYRPIVTLLNSRPRTVLPPQVRAIEATQVKG